MHSLHPTTLKKGTLEKPARNGRTGKPCEILWSPFLCMSKGLGFSLARPPMHSSGICCFFARSAKAIIAAHAPLQLEQSYCCLAFCTNFLNIIQDRLQGCCICCTTREWVCIVQKERPDAGRTTC